MLTNFQNQFVNTKVSQGSVATHLRGDGIFNDQFFTHNHCRVQWRKNFESRSAFAEVIRKNIVCLLGV